MFTVEGKYATAKVFADLVDNETMGQITKMTNHPAFELPDGEHIAIMPDTHAGKGSVIGFTMPLQGRVVPNVVGVDIGCGMLGVRYHATSTDFLESIDQRIRSEIPMGFEVNEKSQHRLVPDSPFWQRLQRLAIRTAESYQRRGYDPMQIKTPFYCYEWYRVMCDRVGMSFGRAQASIGSLGGGNHFIELGHVVDSQNLWVIVHSGSRQLGEKVCRYWQNIATQANKSKRGREYEEQIRKIRETAKNEDIPGLIEEYRKRAGVHSGPKELDYLEGRDFFDYIWDMLFAQQYAAENRMAMMRTCLGALGYDDFFPAAKWGKGHVDSTLWLETVHNYIDFEDLVIRKGAVRAHKEEDFILPFNMRDGTIICRAKGNRDWNNSAPHGAGRLFSRSHAKRTLDYDEARRQMEGICTSVIPLDEAPGAYKDAAMIEAAIEETAWVSERVKPILNIKAG